MIALRRPAYLRVQLYRDGAVGVSATCAHVTSGKPIPDEFGEELVAYAEALQSVLRARP